MTNGSWQQLTESIIKADTLITTRDIAKELNVNHSMAIQHLSKLERWKGSISGCCMNWTKKNKKEKIILKCHLLLFYATTMNHFSIHCDIQWKADFNKTSSDYQLSDWTKKKLQSAYQIQTWTKKSSCSLLGGLLPVWSTKLSEFQGDHYIW